MAKSKEPSTGADKKIKKIAKAVLEAAELTIQQEMAALGVHVLRSEARVVLVSTAMSKL